MHMQMRSRIATLSTGADIFINADMHRKTGVAPRVQARGPECAVESMRLASV